MQQSNKDNVLIVSNYHSPYKRAESAESEELSDCPNQGTLRTMRKRIPKLGDITGCVSEYNCHGQRVTTNLCERFSKISRCLDFQGETNQDRMGI